MSTMTRELLSMEEKLKTFSFLLEDKVGYEKVSCPEWLQGLYWCCLLSACGSFDTKV